MTEKIKIIGAAIAGIFVGICILLLMTGSSALGSVYNQVAKDFSEGISVDGTTVIDGSGNVVAPVASTGAISGTTGTFTGALSALSGAFSGYLDSNAGFVEGGQLTISTTSAAYTLTAAQMKAAKVISIADTASSAALALTLPATSTMTTLLPSAGDTQEWIIDNLHSDAATTTTISVGDGMDFDGTGANDDVVNGGVSARLECFRLVDTNVRCIVEEFVDAG